MITYGLVTVLAPIDGDVAETMKGWLDGLPENALFDATLIQGRSESDLENAMVIARDSMLRGVSKRGWPDGG